MNLIRERYSMLFTVLVALHGCGIWVQNPKKPGDGTTPSGGQSSAIYLRVAQTNLKPAASLVDEFTLTGLDATTFRNSSIASGLADEVHLLVKSIELTPVGIGTKVPIFADPAGKEIVIRKGNSVDLSALFTKISCLDAAGAPIALPAGKSCDCGLDAKGNVLEKITNDATGKALPTPICPQVPDGGTPPVGSMSVNQKGTYGKITITFAALGKVKGCVTGVFRDDSAAHTYCTQAGKDPFGATAFTNADFENLSPALMDINLTGQAETASDQISLDFGLSGNVTIDDDSRPVITLLVDSGRFLRYYNGFPTGSKNPGFQAKGTGWFTPFQSSIYMFLGQPGVIQGYSWTTSALNPGDLNKAPSDYHCEDHCTTVNGWLSLVRDGKGAPLLAAFMPDDDNTLTVIKGANALATGVDAKGIVAKGTGFDVTYTLGSAFSGTVYGLDLSTGVATSQETYFTVKVNDQGQTAYGRVAFKREF